MESFFEKYENHINQRAAQNLPPLPLSAEQTQEVVTQLRDVSPENGEAFRKLLENRVTPGVDPAAKIKADFLLEIATGTTCAAISPESAIELLGTMLGGYNIKNLIKLLAMNDARLSSLAANALKKNILIFEAFDEIQQLTSDNPFARELIQSWADAEWFTRLPVVPESLKCVVYKVNGEINTDDLSPASQAFTRADIPLHALSMGGKLFPDGPRAIAELKQQTGLDVAFVGDVVGTGSSRKSACNSLLWHIGQEIPFVPNKKRGGVILAGLIAPIFFNTAEDSGALPLETDVSQLETGMVIEINLNNGEIRQDGQTLATFKIKPETLLDEYRAGGRVPLIIGKQLTARARKALNLSAQTDIFTRIPTPNVSKDQKFTLAQKMVGHACGVAGVLPGTSCLPKMTTVGSQDTTGPMTAGEMVELACLKFQADFVMQSFCHTAAYPKAADIQTHKTLPGFFQERGGIALRPGDGVIHTWLNRFILPDTVGTGGDSHTRFPLGISVPAGSGLIAFAAALGFMPLDMPESVLVRFSGKMRPGITLRDVVNAIPYFAIKNGLLTVEKQGKKNVFAGRILEMEGLPDLKAEQAFELTDASAERSAAAATIKLNREPVAEYLRSNITLMQAMLQAGYQDADALQTRIAAMEDWLNHGELLAADPGATYAAVLEIDLAEITEPIVACPNDPDDVRLLSEVANDQIDEVFIGSCMTNIGHYRAAAQILEDTDRVPPRLWICPPTKMDANQLREEGIYANFADADARVEMPGCSLCMGNQARVRDNANVFSTSTRNFNNRMGYNARVYLGSSELAAIVARLGRIPNSAEYFDFVENKISGKEADIYRYLQFDEIPDFSV